MEARRGDGVSHGWRYIKAVAGRGGIVGINVTPMVDVVLVLLVIMMVSATYIVSQSLKVELPKTASSDDTVAKTYVVTITKDGNYSSTTSRSRGRLAEGVPRRAWPRAEDVNLVITADEDAHHGKVVDVIDLAKVEGITKFAINVEQEVSRGASILASCSRASPCTARWRSAIGSIEIKKSHAATAISYAETQKKKPPRTARQGRANAAARKPDTRVARPSRAPAPADAPAAAEDRRQPRPFDGLPDFGVSLERRRGRHGHRVACRRWRARRADRARSKRWSARPRRRGGRAAERTAATNRPRSPSRSACRSPAYTPDALARPSKARCACSSRSTKPAR